MSDGVFWVKSLTERTAHTRSTRGMKEKFKHYQHVKLALFKVGHLPANKSNRNVTSKVRAGSPQRSLRERS